MKRILFITAVLAAGLFTSCKKNVDPDLPAISWASNEKWAQMELAPGADGAISITAPGEIQSLTVSLNLGVYNILANPYIGTTANKGSASKSPVLDIIDDSTVASFLKDLGMTGGSGLRGKTIATLELVDILEKFITGQTIENNTAFSMDVNVTDKAGNVATKTAKFHFTSAPTYVWDGNSNFELVDLAAPVPAKIKVQAPGKIAELVITLDSGVKELENFIKNRTGNGGTVINLVTDDKVAESFKTYFPAGSNVTGKTDLILDFSFMYSQSYDFSAGTNVFTIYTKDANGKEASQQVKFKK